MLQGTVLYADGPKDNCYEQLEMLLLIAPLPGKPPRVQSRVLMSHMGDIRLCGGFMQCPLAWAECLSSMGVASNIKLTLKADLKKENLLRA